MSKINVTQGRIDYLINSADVKVETAFDGRCTTVIMELKNGFILTESSTNLDPISNAQEMQKRMCYKHIENRLWELEEYALRELEAIRLAPEERGEPTSWDCKRDFGWALRQLRRGQTVRRRGWNGKGIFIELQVPDKHSKMSSPYIFIDTTGLQTNNPDAPKNRVPWLASQTDMLAQDWELFD